MADKEKLQIGQVYSTFLNAKEMGPYLYLGTRRRFNVRRLEFPGPVHNIAGYHKKRIASWWFDEEDYILEDKKLVLRNRMDVSMDKKQLRYLEDRLTRAGIEQ